MNSEIVTEIPIGNTLYIITSKCSPTATETVARKLERLILRHVSDIKSYQSERDDQLAMYTNQSEYGTDTI